MCTPTNSRGQSPRVVHDGDRPGGGGAGGDGGGRVPVSSPGPRLAPAPRPPLLLPLLVLGGGSLLSVAGLIILGRLSGVLNCQTLGLCSVCLSRRYH